MLHSLTLFIVGTFTLVSCESYFIAPPNSSDCVGDNCLTLAQFNETTTTSNITLIMLEGEHVIDFGIEISGITELHILPLDCGYVNISCLSFESFTFTNINHVDIQGLTFVGCDGIEFESVDQLTIENSTFVGRDSIFSMLTIASSSVHVTDSYFLSNVAGTDLLDLFGTSVGGAIVVINGSLQIDNCVFEENKSTLREAVKLSSQTLTLSQTMLMVCLMNLI